MIIQCESCSRKFLVDDTSIPTEGRMVQCGNCSQKWFQKSTSSLTTNIKKYILDDTKNSSLEIKASDGQLYRFLGNQWAKVLPSGKMGMLARKNISTELNKLSGKSENKNIETNIHPKTIDPSSQDVNSNYINKKVHYEGLGFSGYIILFIIIFLSGIGFLKTFENEILHYFPKSEYIFETLENVFVIVKDLLNSY